MRCGVCKVYKMIAIIDTHTQSYCHGEIDVTFRREVWKLTDKTLRETNVEIRNSEGRDSRRRIISWFHGSRVTCHHEHGSPDTIEYSANYKGRDYSIMRHGTEVRLYAPFPDARILEKETGDGYWLRVDFANRCERITLRLNQSAFYWLLESLDEEMLYSRVSIIKSRANRWANL